MEQVIVANVAAFATYAWVRFCDWKLKPWMEGRKPSKPASTTFISAHEAAAKELFSLRYEYDTILMANPSLTADERARARRAYLDKVRRLADRLAYLDKVLIPADRLNA